MAMADEHRSNAGKYAAIYVVILVIAALQFVVAYSNISGGQMLTRMLILACVEAAFALLFFMHLADNRPLMWFVVIFTVALLDCEGSLSSTDGKKDLIKTSGVNLIAPQPIENSLKANLFVGEA